MALAHLSTPSLSADLQPYLSPNAVAALISRAEALTISGLYPLPPEDYRALPYPPL